MSSIVSQGVSAASSASVHLVGGDESDTLGGTEGRDTLEGGGGDDFLSGEAGDDVLDGGSGADALSGGDGDDTLIGGDGDDVLDGGNGADRLSGGAGDDVLLDFDGDSTVDGGEGNDTLFTGAGADLLIGGANDDALFGGDGDDTYEGGTGNDSLSDSGVTADAYRYQLGDGVDSLADSGGVDRVEIGIGITAAATTVTAVGGHLVLGFSDGGSLTLQDQYAEDTGAALSETSIEQIVFRDGTVWDATRLRQLAGLSNDIVGSNGDDILAGRAEPEHLLGLAGNDQLSGADGDDTLDGGEGDDALFGGEGNDLYEAGAGDDRLVDESAGSGDTYRYGPGGGADTLSDAGGTDTVQLGVGISADTTTVRRNDAGALVLGFADGGSLTLNAQYDAGTGAALSDTQIEQVVFADGTVWDAAQLRVQALIGTNGADTIRGFDGDDVINGAGGDDTLVGADGNDRLVGGEGNDTYDAGRGNDILSDAAAGSGDFYRYQLGDGTDMLDDAGGVDTVGLGAGITTAQTRVRRDATGALVLGFADGGSLTLRGQYDGSTGAAQADTQAEQVVFADGTVWNQEHLRAQALAGSDADDSILGFNSDDLIAGADGDDTLAGADGNDQLAGGTGSDTYEGGRGDDRVSDDSGSSGDRYRYNLGDGADTLSDAGGADLVQLGAGIAAAGTTARRDATGALVLGFADGGSLRLTSQYDDSTGEALAATQVEQIVFADGTVWEQAQLRAQSLIGTEGADLILGFNTDDVLSGAGGDDTLVGADGNDQLAGGAGLDRLSGGAGNDTLSGGEGNDVYEAGSGTDSLNDTSTNSGDTYRYNLGDGVDMLSDAGGADTVQLGAGITAAGTTVRRDAAGALVLGFADGGSLRLNAQYDAGTGAALAATQVEQVIFADGTVWDQQQLRAQALAGTDGADLILGFSTDDVLSGAGGDDTLLGANGDDLLAGGAGNDRLNGGSGSDTLNGGEGNDVYEAGGGNDSLTDSAASSGDIYRYNLGDGTDTLSDAGGSDAVQLGAGITAAGTTVRRDASGALVLGLADGGSLRLTAQYDASTGAALTGTQIEQISFADGTVWDQAQLRALSLIGSEGADAIFGFDSDDTLLGTGGDDTLDGGAGNDQLLGGAGGDSLSGGTGSDFLFGDAGNDSLSGATGDDQLFGGEGNDSYEAGTGNDRLTDSSASSGDTYRYNLGDGVDTLIDAGGVDTVRLGAGLTTVNTTVRRDAAGDLLLSFVDGGSLRLSGQYDGNTGAALPDAQIEQSVFADGTVWSQAQLRAQALQGSEAADTILGFSTDDVLTGAGGDDTLAGADGNDQLLGGAGHDRLIGGAGSDTLTGGEGNDTYEAGSGNDSLIDSAFNSGDSYRYDFGDGADTISDAGGTDTVKLGAGITAANTGVRIDSHGALVLDFADGGSLRLEAQYDMGIGAALFATQIEQVVFADGTVWDQAQLRALSLIGTEGADAILGLDTDDTLVGLGGDDTLDGRNGNDQVIGGAGNDSLSGGAGSDFLTGDAGNDSLSGGAGDDYLIGESGNDILAGDAGADNLYGGDGDDVLGGGGDNDNLYGGEGADAYAGGTGADILIDYSGNSGDTYRYNLGDGVDAVSDYGGADSVQLGGGITAANTTVRRNAVGALVLSFPDGGSLTLSSQYDATTVGALPDTQIEQVTFADGTVWDQAQMRQLALARGSEGADEIFGFESDDSLNGAAGDDTLGGADGNDTLYGGAGNDSLMGGSGNDYLDGEEGNNTLDGGAGDDFLYVSSISIGNDLLVGGEGNDTLRAGGGDDRYEGGTGNDLLTDWSDTSADLYVYRLGDGFDTVDDYGGTDTVRLTGGISPATTTVRQDIYGRLVLQFADGGTLTMELQYDGLSGAALSVRRIEQVEFDDGTVWDQASMRALAVAGTDGNDVLVGFDGRDELFGYGGDDILYGRNGDDYLYGWDGNDQLYGEAGIDGMYGYDGDDSLFGGAGNDSYAGGTGNDTAYDTSTTSADSYSYDLGDGVDTVRDVGGTDSVWLGFGLTMSGTRVWQNSDGALVLSFNAGGSVTLAAQYDTSTGAARAADQIEQINFSNGTAWNQATLRSLALVGADTDDSLYGFDSADSMVGGAGNDLLFGRNGADTVDGGAGDDVLFGEAGNDRLIGGAGVDLLNGGEGNDTFESGQGNDTLTDASVTSGDTYVYNLGDGSDRVGDAGGADVVRLGAGITAAATQVRVGAAGHLTLLFSDGGSLRLNSQYSDTGAALAANQIEQVIFSGGTTWTQAQMRTLALTGSASADIMWGFDGADAMTGAAGNDFLFGRSGNDTLDGGADNDTLVGDAGNDTLTGGAGLDSLNGGAGNDALNGGVGNDTYIFAPGTGADTVTDSDSTSGNIDLMSIGAGVATNQLWFRQVGTSLEVSIIGTSDKMTISNWYSGTANHVEQFKTSDGKTLLDTKVAALVSAMAAFAPPAAGQTTLPDAYQASLNAVIVANWV